MSDNFDVAETRSGGSSNVVSLSKRQIQMVLGVVVLVAALALGWALWPSSPTNASLIRDAVADIKAGNYDAATAKLQKELDQNKANHNNLNAIVYFDLGVIAGKQGNNTQAASYYAQSITLAPHYEPALYNLAVTTMNQGNKSLAIVQFNNVLAVNPRNARALYNSGLLMYRLNQITDGRARMNQAIALDPTLATRVPADVTLN